MTITWRTSTSSGGNGCVEVGWRISSYCHDGSCVEVGWTRSACCQGGGCVEASERDGRILIRDSKRGKASPQIGFTPAGWRAFTDYAPEWDRETEVTVSGVRITKMLGIVSDVCLADDDARDRRHLHYTWEEWDAFVKGAQAGEFAVEVLAGSTG